MLSKLLQISIAFAVFLFISCHSTSAQTNKFTTADLQKLRWIEGTWKGTGDVDKPFFERYRFEGDSALLVDGFADATLTKVNDTTRFELKDGEFGGGSEGDRWVAKSIDDHAIEFVPAVKERSLASHDHVSGDERQTRPPARVPDGTHTAESRRRKAVGRNHPPISQVTSERAIASLVH